MIAPTARAASCFWECCEGASHGGQMSMMPYAQSGSETFGCLREALERAIKPGHSVVGCG